MKVYFIHGGGSTDTTDQTLESFPVYLRHIFQESFDMVEIRHTSDFEGLIQKHAEAINSFQPDIVIGKSQGGPTILHLIERQLWRGPSILCCPAIIGSLDPLELPKDIPFTIIIGKEDEQVPYERIMKYFVEPNQESLDELNLEVIITNDYHNLSSTVRNMEDYHSLYQAILRLNQRKEKMEKLGLYSPEKRIPAKTLIQIEKGKKSSAPYISKCLLQ